MSQIPFHLVHGMDNYIVAGFRIQKKLSMHKNGGYVRSIDVIPQFLIRSCVAKGDQGIR